MPILRDGRPARPDIDLTAVPEDVLPSTIAVYASRGFVPPFIDYLAVVGGRAVGTCGVPAPPRAGRVEVAYFTFPGAEGRGVATEMARLLVGLARAAQPGLTLFAHTLPRAGASTTILARLGFALVGTVKHPEDGLVWEWHLAPAHAGLPRSPPPL